MRESCLFNDNKVPPSQLRKSAGPERSGDHSSRSGSPSAEPPLPFQASSPPTRGGMLRSTGRSGCFGHLVRSRSLSACLPDRLSGCLAVSVAWTGQVAARVEVEAGSKVLINACCPGESRFGTYVAIPRVAPITFLRDRGGAGLDGRRRGVMMPNIGVLLGVVIFHAFSTVFSRDSSPFFFFLFQSPYLFPCPVCPLTFSPKIGCSPLFLTVSPKGCISRTCSSFTFSMSFSASSWIIVPYIYPSLFRRHFGRVLLLSFFFLYCW